MIIPFLLAWISELKFKKNYFGISPQATEFNQWKRAEKMRLEEAKIAEEAATAVAEKEKAKRKAAVETAQAAQRIAEFEALKRKSAEMKALKEAEDRKKAQEGMTYDIRYRKYTIEEIEAATHEFSGSLKIGEGGYGPVYRGELDHTSVAIKVLRPDAAQGHSQFKREVCVFPHDQLLFVTTNFLLQYNSFLIYLAHKQHNQVQLLISRLMHLYIFKQYTINCRCI